LHLDDLFRRHAELLDHLIAANLLVLHGVVECYLVGDQLHQVLVGRHDAHGGTSSFGLARIGGDEIIGFVVVLLDAGDVEGNRGLTDQPNCGTRSSGASGRWALYCG
jgi:hypothetical protein